MNGLANEHAGWFQDVRRILDVVEITPGLPLPHVSPDRASFYFTHIVHAADASEAVTAALVILGYAFGVTFRREAAQSGSTRWYVYEALLPSGLIVALTVKAQHIDACPVPEDAPEMAEAGAAA